MTSSHAPSGGKQNKGMWDRWLLVRFTIAFVSLSVFEVTNTLFQIRAVMNAESDAAASAPDFSAERAKGAWIFFMPGVTPGLFIFIVFGTTTPLRRYMYETIVPTRWQRQYRAERKAAAGGAARSRSDTGPPVPPKDDLEMQPYHDNNLSKSQTGIVVRSVKGNREYGEEASRCDSDEFPILPGYKNPRRH
jgi:hypothetical protein